MATVHAPSANHAPVRNFILHFFEMVAAMFIGMMVIGGPVSLILLAIGHRDTVLEHADLRALVMSINMTVGMTLWMRYRGHNWLQTGEMGAAMFVPLAVLIYPYWSGLLSSGALAAGTHLLMLPAMLGIMLVRWDVYSQGHRAHTLAPHT